MYEIDKNNPNKKIYARLTGLIIFIVIIVAFILDNNYSHTNNKNFNSQQNINDSIQKMLIGFWLVDKMIDPEKRIIKEGKNVLGYYFEFTKKRVLTNIGHFSARYKINNKTLTVKLQEHGWTKFIEILIIENDNLTFNLLNPNGDVCEIIYLKK